MNTYVETKIEKDERKITFWIFNYLNSILHSWWLDNAKVLSVIIRIVFCIRIYRLQIIEMQISLVSKMRLEIKNRIRFAQRTRYKSALSFLELWGRIISCSSAVRSSHSIFNDSLWQTRSLTLAQFCGLWDSLRIGIGMHPHDALLGVRAWSGWSGGVWILPAILSIRSLSSATCGLSYGVRWSMAPSEEERSKQSESPSEANVRVFDDGW